MLGVIPWQVAFGLEEAEDQVNFGMVHNRVTLSRFYPRQKQRSKEGGPCSKKNKQWVWLALNIVSRQVIACHIGGREKESVGFCGKGIKVF